MSRLFLRKTEGIVNVKMVITEEKILSNIDKIQKLINPKSKKQIVKLEEDSYFKDLVESVKSYLLEYPKKNSFPTSVYNAAYGLVETATNQFEENTKTVEELIRKREKNIKLGSVLRDASKVVKANAKNWKAIVKKLEPKYSPDVAENLMVIGSSEDKESDEYKKACKFIDVKISNLEANLHIEIDMERIEDTSKALSYIGLEIAEALKYIPAPAAEVLAEQADAGETETKANSKAKSQDAQKDVEQPKTKFRRVTRKPKVDNKTNIDEEIENETQEVEAVETEDDYEDAEGADEAQDTQEVQQQTQPQKQAKIVNGGNGGKGKKVQKAVVQEDFEEEDYIEETRFEKKPSLWQRIKNSKLVRTINYILKIRVVLDYPALPDANTTEK